MNNCNAQEQSDSLNCKSAFILRHILRAVQTLPSALRCRPEDKKFFKQQGVVFGVGEATNTSVNNRVARQRVEGEVACCLSPRYDMKEYLQLRGVMPKSEVAQGPQHSSHVRMPTPSTSASPEVVDLTASNRNGSAAASGLIDLTG